MTDFSPISLAFADAYMVAIQYYTAGQWHESRHTLMQLLETQPEHIPALQLLATVALQEADAKTAEDCFERLLKISSESADVALHVGIMAEAGGFPKQAEIALRQATAVNPNSVDARYYLARLLLRNGRMQEAVEAFDELIGLAPQFIDAYVDLAHAFALLDRINDAEVLLRRSLVLMPESPELHNALAQILERAGRIDEAEAAYHSALAFRPDFREPLNNLINLLNTTQRRKEAETWCLHGLRLRPFCADMYRNLAMLLSGDERWTEAEAACREALRFNPGRADLLNNLGIVLRECGRTAEAEAACLEALHLQPEFADALHNLALLRKNAGQVDSAEQLCREALRLKPDYIDAHNHAGILALDAGRLDEAEAAFNKVLQIQPNNRDAPWCLSILHLLRGEFEPGWRYFEHRWESALRKFRREFSAPRWDGQVFNGQTLLIHCEQGLGDCLQFVRYLPMVTARGGKVLLECPEELQRLFETVPGIEACIFYGGGLPEFDLHCPLLSLPLLFGTRVDTIPAVLPYLTVPAKIRGATPRLAASSGASLKVGLAWAGNPTHKNDLNRSLCFEWLEPLFGLPGITWVILQQQRRPDGFEAFAARHTWLDPIQNATDMADTAAVMEQLDLMIGVDSALIHLAGALGIATWALIPFNPDWRWMLVREDSPWYPGMRLFRQKQRNTWPDVIENVRLALTGYKPQP